MSFQYITEEDIRQVLLENVAEGETSGRELMRSSVPARKEGDVIGSVMYSLSGLPPRGYALYIPELERVNFYAPGGERFEQREDVAGVAEVDQVIQAIVELLQESEFVATEDLREGLPEAVSVLGEEYETMGAAEAFSAAVRALKERGVVVEDEENGELRLTL